MYKCIYVGLVIIRPKHSTVSSVYYSHIFERIRSGGFEVNDTSDHALISLIFRGESNRLLSDIEQRSRLNI